MYSWYTELIIILLKTALAATLRLIRDEDWKTDADVVQHLLRRTEAARDLWRSLYYFHGTYGEI